MNDWVNKFVYGNDGKWHLINSIPVLLCGLTLAEVVNSHLIYSGFKDRLTSRVFCDFHRMVLINIIGPMHFHKIRPRATVNQRSA